MSIEEGRVSEAEVVRVVALLSDLAARAEAHGQTFLFIALNLGAESLADNANMSMEMDDDAHDC